MSWSSKIGRLAGIDIYVHFTFLILLGWFISNERALAHSWSEVMQSTICLLSLFFCVVLHEIGHALMARRFGIRTKDIFILPIGGIARLERIPEVAYQEFLVAVAGPATSIVISVVAFLVCLGQLYFVPHQNWDVSLFEPEWFWQGGFALQLAIMNFFLGVLNLIPAFPMDGGRIFRSLLAMVINHTTATRTASALGQLFAFAFIILGIYLSHFMLGLIGVFIFFAARAECRETLQKSALKDIPVEYNVCYNIPSISANKRVGDCLDLFLTDTNNIYWVADAAGEYVGLLYSENLANAIHFNNLDSTLGEICMKPSYSIDRADSMIDAYSKIRCSEMSALPVFENGKLVGIFTTANVTKWINLSSACKKNKVSLTLYHTDLTGKKNNNTDVNQTNTGMVSHAPVAGEVPEPQITEPQITEPQITEPQITEPQITEPQIIEAEIVEAEIVEAELVEPESAETVSVETVLAEPDDDDLVAASEVAIVGRGPKVRSEFRRTLGSQIPGKHVFRKPFHSRLSTNTASPLTAPVAAQSSQSMKGTTRVRYRHSTRCTLGQQIPGRKAKAKRFGRSSSAAMPVRTHIQLPSGTVSSGMNTGLKSGLKVRGNHSTLGGQIPSRNRKRGWKK